MLDKFNKLFIYDKETGLITRKISSGSRGLIGNVAGCKTHQGYIEISVGDKAYGFKGCYRVGSKWRVQCRVDKKLFNLGYFENIDDARKAYNEFAFSKFGEFSVKS